VSDRSNNELHEPIFPLEGLEPLESVGKALFDEDAAMTRIFSQSQDILDAIRAETEGSVDARTEPTFPISRAAELVGRSDSMIREAEKNGRLPEPQRGENGRGSITSE